jgi:hypothetical protein
MSFCNWAMIAWLLAGMGGWFGGEVFSAQKY